MDHFPEEHRIEGKTYSLFGSDPSPDVYYKLIHDLTDKLLEKEENPEEFLSFIQKLSQQKRLLRKISKYYRPNDKAGALVHILNQSLSVYTQNTPKHLKSLPFWKFTDRRLRTSREQYHLYMIEIELRNRLNKNAFLETPKKIALLPYCLQDFSSNCKAGRDGLDYQCKSCSKNCFQNHASHILKEYGIEPYIWMESDLKKMTSTNLTSGQKTAIFGIACIPELVAGMRRCQKLGVPAMGLPLNANRCIRWFGEFHPNSIHFEQLLSLLKS